ncbi:rRNA maturation RNase YbeY [Acaricomes phytoseiuli]|uniref:rRNA maturation RNase YbeY n=1 Tax=Acaricomes phytoseiuli TaxID=291968 RepID=UPI0003720B7D|nr:rRNA maturation RNase YbeY [Acaricomes phytoseiuli]MCW1249178.1 rRNA maturation RNase YbeY [Acaricomes phytoseiuli]
MSIEVANESGIEADSEAIVRLSRYIFDALSLHPQTELSVLLVDEEAMERLHLEQLDEPGATDVISIPMDELRPGTATSPAPQGLLGDIVICPQVAQRQAAAGGHTTDDEILLLTTHGLLHLLGYDHETEAERDEMFALQRRLLSDFLGRPAPAETVS